MATTTSGAYRSLADDPPLSVATEWCGGNRALWWERSSLFLMNLVDNLVDGSCLEASSEDLKWTTDGLCLDFYAGNYRGQATTKQATNVD